MLLRFVGDISLKRSQGDDGVVFSNDPFSRMQPWFSDCDLVSGNLECFFTKDLTNSSEWKHHRAMKAHVAMADCLRSSRFSALSLANNHVMDGGSSGLSCTLSTLENLEVPRFGAGWTASEASDACVIERQGKTVGFLGFGDSVEDFVASDGPGINPLTPYESVIRAVENLADRCDVVVVQLHADLEFTPAPAPYRVKLSRRLVDAGATLVVQHHPHALQGVEIYQRGLIAYSLGNFVFPLKNNSYQKDEPDARYGGVLTVDLDKKCHIRSWSIEPVHIDDTDSPVPLVGDVRERALTVFEDRCRMLQHPKRLRRIWRRRCMREARYHALISYYRLRSRGARPATQYASGVLRSKQNWPWFRGLVSCGYA